MTNAHPITVNTPEFEEARTRLAQLLEKEYSIINQSDGKLDYMTAFFLGHENQHKLKPLLKNSSLTFNDPVTHFDKDFYKGNAHIKRYRDDAYRCDNCEFTAFEADFLPAKNLSMRLTQGGMYTEVECPHCHALAFATSVEEELKDLYELCISRMLDVTSTAEYKIASLYGKIITHKFEPVNGQTNPIAKLLTDYFEGYQLTQELALSLLTESLYLLNNKIQSLACHALLNEIISNTHIQVLIKENKYMSEPWTIPEMHDAINEELNISIDIYDDNFTTEVSSHFNSYINY